jgi:2'-5' RNA ligase
MEGAGGGVRVLDADRLHLTLCFLGARPVSELDALAAVLPACAGHACELSLGAPLWLPPRRPRALAVEVRDEEGELGRLQSQVAGALAAAGEWEPERRRFRPHITVARMRADRARRDAARRPPATPSMRFAPEWLTLYRSWLSRDGASYEVMARCALLPPDG